MRKLLPFAFVPALVIGLAGSHLGGVTPTQAAGCKAFGLNGAFLAQTLGPAFGATAYANAPLNTLVEQVQAAFCAP